MRFENAKVFNFEGAFRGMRNPKESWNLSDSLPINVNGTWLTDDEKKKEEAKNLYEYLSCFAAGGLISILSNWLKAEDPLPPEAMITITDMILYDTLDSRRLLR